MRFACLLSVLCCGALFLGCPTPPANENPDPPVVDTGEIPAGFGAVVMEGNLLNDSKSIENLNEVVDYLRPHVETLEVTFYPAGGGLGKAATGDDWNFTLEVADDGSYSGRFFITPGSYIISVSAMDNDGRGLFLGYSDDEIEVSPGETQSASVLLGLRSRMLTRFSVPDLPGVYGDSDYEDGGSVQVVDNDGNVYDGYYYRWYFIPDGEIAIQSAIVFSVYLPIDFDGEEDGGALVVEDQEGNTWAAELPLSVFDTYCCLDAQLGVPEVEYVFPDWLGEVDLDIGFIEY